MFFWNHLFQMILCNKTSGVSGLETWWFRLDFPRHQGQWITRRIINTWLWNNCGDVGWKTGVDESFSLLGRTFDPHKSRWKSSNGCTGPQREHEA